MCTCTAEYFDDIKKKCSFGGFVLNGFISCLIQFECKAIHKIQERKRLYKKSTIQNGSFFSNASVNLLDLLLGSKNAVESLAQPLAQILVDVGTGILCRNCRSAALEMRHRIALRQRRVVLVAR